MAIRSTTCPLNMSVADWAACLRIDWSQEYVPEYIPNTDWRVWGMRLIADNIALQGAAPDPSGFDNFQDWAVRVFEATS